MAFTIDRRIKKVVGNNREEVIDFDANGSSAGEIKTSVKKIEFAIAHGRDVTDHVIGTFRNSTTDNVEDDQPGSVQLSGLADGQYTLRVVGK